MALSLGELLASEDPEVRLRGVYNTVPTQFDEAGELDEASLAG